jgi:hypothetical protein
MSGPSRLQSLAVEGGLGLLAGAIIGGVSAFLLVQYPPFAFAQRGDNWLVSRDFGTQQSNLWLKAHVATQGLFALPPSEAIYFVAKTDASGNRLQGNCRYRIQGAVPKGGFATLTVYGSDDFLIPNKAKRYSIRLSPQSPAQAITIASAGEGVSWLPVAQGEPFSIMLRIYEPSSDLIGQLDRVSLPTVSRLDCTS